MKIKLRNIPLLSMLAITNWQCHKKSLLEFTILFFSAWLPVTIDTGLRWLVHHDNFNQALFGALSAGQIFIYICSILGSLFYLSIDFDFKRIYFQNATSFKIATLLLIIITLVIYVTYRLNQISKDSISALNMVSICVYIFTAILWYLSISYRNIPDEKITEFNRSFEKSSKKIINDLNGYQG